MVKKIQEESVKRSNTNRFENRHKPSHEKLWRDVNPKAS